MDTESLVNFLNSELKKTFTFHTEGKTHNILKHTVPWKKQHNYVDSAQSSYTLNLLTVAKWLLERKKVFRLFFLLEERLPEHFSNVVDVRLWQIVT